jgi:peptide/nickel transport system substrate-binding protein
MLSEMMEGRTSGFRELPAGERERRGDPQFHVAVGTGPYKLKDLHPQGFTLTKNTVYWQISKAKVPNVYFLVYTSNTGALRALFSDQIDWTGNFIPGLQKDFVAKDPAHHHFWEAPGSTNAFIPQPG